MWNLQLKFTNLEKGESSSVEQKSKEGEKTGAGAYGAITSGTKKR